MTHMVLIIEAIRSFNQKSGDIHTELEEIMIEELNEHDIKTIMQQFSDETSDNTKLEVLGKYKLKKDERGKFYISYW